MELVARGTARVRVGWPARVLLDPSQRGARDWCPAETIDLSPRGIALRWRGAEADAPRVSQPVWVEVAAQGDGVRKIWRWSGRVANVSRDGRALRIGVAFLWPVWNGFRMRTGVPMRPRERLLRVDRVRLAPLLPSPPAKQVRGKRTTPACRGRRPCSAFWLAVAVALLGVWLDQATKWLVAQGASQTGVLPIGSHTVQFGPIVANAGSFGGLGHKVPGAGLISAGCGLVILTVLVRWAWRDSLRWRRVDAIGWGLVLAGLTGNLSDRLLCGHVRDFLAASFLPGWVFNVADVLAVCGAIVLLAACLPALVRSNPAARALKAAA